MRRRFLRSPLLLAIVLALCVQGLCSCEEKKYNLPVRALEIVTADGRHVRVDAELAIKDEEQSYGYMNRTTIPDGTGMLFIFDHDQRLSFWMKNTPHPLSIAYIDSSGIIRDIFDMTPYSLSSVRSSRSVRYALEVPQGWFEREQITVGDSVVSADGRSLQMLP